MLGRRLREAREALGIRQKGAAEAIGISESGISEMEGGRREPKAAQLAVLARLYRRSLDFFFGDEPAGKELVLWRCRPSDEAQEKSVQRDFLKLCEDYYTLERLTDNAKPSRLPAEQGSKDRFGYSQTRALASRIWSDLALGAVPAASLRSVLEERHGVKVFALPMKQKASALCTRHEIFGPCILLNRSNVSWRRNYDLAHELFHLLTWQVFRSADQETPVQAEAFEESLANCFASSLLLPEPVFAERVNSFVDKDDNFACTFGDVHDLAREFQVSAEAVIYRIAGLLRWKSEKTSEVIARLKESDRPTRRNEKVPPFSARYVDLTVQAYRDGLITFSKAAGFLRMRHRKAERLLEPSEGAVEFDAPITVDNP